MTILLLDMHDGPGGGVERFSKAIATTLRANGLAVQREVRRSHRWVRFEYASYCLRVAVAAVRRRPHLVIATHTHLAPAALLAARLTGVRFAVLTHGREAWLVRSRTVLAALRHADRVWAPSQFTLRQLSAQRVRPHSLGLLQPPVHDARPATADARTRGKLLTVARLENDVRYKGVDEVILALPLVSQEFTSAQLVVVGEGPDRGRLQEIARSAGVADRVHFLGRVSDNELAHEYATARVFVLPSKTQLRPTPMGEGFGLVYLEAASAGLPSIAADTGAPTEVVRNEISGLTVPVTPQSIAAASLRLITDDHLWHRLSTGALQVAAEFAVERFAERLLDEVSRLSAGSGSTASETL